MQCSLWPIHRLQEEVWEVKVLEALRLCALLRKDELEFIARTEYEFRPGFGADADPIDAVGWKSRARALRNVATADSCP